MPTRTFFNLPENKREKLLKAIHAEFSRVSFEEVSINRIIHAAEISRGSFYQYFEDKNDMLCYLLSDYRRVLFDNAIDSLKRNNGDMFMMFSDIYDFSYSFVCKVKGNDYLKSLLSDIRINIDPNTTDDTGGFIEKLLPHVKTETLDIREENDLENMLGIMLTLTGEALARTFFDLPRHDDERMQYMARMELIKRGFIKCSDI